MPKSLRKGFNDHIGGDKGGWAITKVLRVPGTRYFKYPQRPRVKLLRDDGPTYRVRDLMRYAADVADVELEGGRGTSGGGCARDPEEVSGGSVSAHWRRSTARWATRDAVGRDVQACHAAV